MARKPFVVIDAEILNSSVWSEASHVRLVWITLLILCDTEGYVGAAIPGIARAAGVTVDEARDALERLQRPDPDSRTKSDEGRRVAVADRGFRVLNFKEHLERLSSERVRSRDRMRKWREHGWQRQRAKIPFPSVGDLCGCCQEPFETPLNRFCVLDHDHQTGVGRAYVCKSCNSLIAKAEAGAPAKESVAKYLASHVTKTSAVVTIGNREQGIGNREKEGRTEEPAPLPADERAERRIKESKVGDERRLLALVSEMETEDPNGRDAAELMRLVTSYDKPDGRRIGGCVNPATLSYERVRKSIEDAEAVLSEWRQAKNVAQ